MANPTTGAKAPTVAATVSEGNWSDDTWVSPANIYGAGYASVTATSFDAGDQTYILKAYTFDFSAIPANATIRGVTCIVNAKYATALASIDCLQLLDVSRARTGTNLCSTPQALTTSDANYTFGSGTNLWGCALTPAWVQDADFGVGIGCLAGGTGNNNVDVYIDSVTLNITYEHVLTTEVTADSIAGQNLTALKAARLLTESVTAYTVVGQDLTGLVKYSPPKVITASVTAFSVTGQNLTSLKATRLLTEDVTAYSVSSQNLTALKIARKLVESATDFPVTGQNLTSLKATRNLTEEVTAFSVTGQNLTNLKSSRLLTGEVASVSVSTQDTGLKVTRLLIQEVTSYSVAEQNLTGLKATRLLTEDVTTFAIVGQNATITYATLGNRNIVTEVTTFAITSQNVGLKREAKIPTSIAEISITGQNATLTYASGSGYTLTTGVSGFTVNDQVALFKIDRKIIASQSLVFITGQGIDLRSVYIHTESSVPFIDRSRMYWIPSHRSAGKILAEGMVSESTYKRRFPQRIW
jgi:hypothetical protein